MMGAVENVQPGYDIKIIKHGLIFFHDVGILLYNELEIKIMKQGDGCVFACVPSDVKRVLYNSDSGIFSLKLKSGKKINFAFFGRFN